MLYKILTFIGWAGLGACLFATGFTPAAMAIALLVSTAAICGAR